MLFINQTITIYLTMSSLIMAGIANMIFTRTKLYKEYKYPIDDYKNFKDGKRIFGDNKTWIGFISMIIFCILFQILLGLLCNQLLINEYNDLYNIRENNIILNLIFGFLIGFIYMIFELPNSFIKRRLDINPGKTERGIKGIVFFIIDQIDSLIGVMLVLFLFSNFSIWKYFAYVIIGAFTHVGINLILYRIKIRRNL